MSASTRRMWWSPPVWRCISLAERQDRTRVCLIQARCRGLGLWWWSQGGPQTVWTPLASRTFLTRCSHRSLRNIDNPRPSLLALLVTPVTTTTRGYKTWGLLMEYKDSPCSLMNTWQYAFDVVKASNWERYFRFKINIPASSQLYPTTTQQQCNFSLQRKYYKVGLQLKSQWMMAAFLWSDGPEVCS